MLSVVPFRRFLIATVGAFANVALLQGTLPLWAASAGAGGVEAGSTWGVMMATTVLTQLGAPWLLARFGHRAMLVASTVVLAGTAPVAAMSTRIELLWALSAVRGVGFGLLTVTGSVLAIQLVPAARRGQGVGLYGLAIGLANLVCLPGGVWLAGKAGFTAVFVAAGVFATLSLASSPRVPRPGGNRDPGRAPRRGGGDRAPGRGNGPRRHPAGQVRPRLGRLSWPRGQALSWSVMAGAAVVGGAVATFVPLAAESAEGPVLTSAAPLALFAFSGAALLSRWAGGALGDRFGHGRSLPPAVIVTGMGTLICGGAIAAGFTGPALLLLVAGAILAGAGFGAIQNDTLVVMFDRAGPDGRNSTSAAWNVAFDAGTGAGATALGVLADQAGHPAVFVAAAAVMLACLPATVVERTRLVRHQVSERRSQVDEITYRGTM